MKTASRKMAGKKRELSEEVRAIAVEELRVAVTQLEFMSDLTAEEKAEEFLRYLIECGWYYKPGSPHLTHAWQDAAGLGEEYLQTLQWRVVKQRTNP